MTDIAKLCQCSVCLRPLALPVTWSCGHSFCKNCTATVVLTTSDDRGRVRCPECRAFAHRPTLLRFGVNNVLGSLIKHLLPAEIDMNRLKAIQKEFERSFAQLKGPTAESGFAGENGGEHTLGFEVIKEEKNLLLRKPDVTASRKIIRDEADYSRYLALCPISSLRFVPTVESLKDWNIKFALLDMEEDEAAETGFPVSLHEHNSDSMDMALIRQTFEGGLECIVKIDGQERGRIEGECDKGVCNLDMGDLFRGSNVSQLGNSIVSVEVSEVLTGLNFYFKFKLARSGASGERPTHLTRYLKQCRIRRNDDNNEPSEEGISIGAESAEEEEEDDEEDDSFDGFIVRDDDDDNEEDDDGFVVSDDEETEEDNGFVVNNEDDFDEDEAISSESGVSEQSEESTPRVLKGRQLKQTLVLSDSDDADDQRQKHFHRKVKNPFIEVSSEDEDELYFRSAKKAALGGSLSGRGENHKPYRNGDKRSSRSKPESEDEEEEEELFADCNLVERKSRKSKQNRVEPKFRDSDKMYGSPAGKRRMDADEEEEEELASPAEIVKKKALIRVVLTDEAPSKRKKH